MKTGIAYLALLTSTLATQSLAGTVSISQTSGTEVLSSGHLNVTPTEKRGLSAASLQAAHATLNANGIATDGKVTIALTDTPQGMALLVLVDQDLGISGSPVVGRLQMSSVVDTARASFLNDSGASFRSSLDYGIRSAKGEFSWNSNGSGSGFAWMNLEPGSSLKFQFSQLGSDSGLDPVNTFQFATWNGSQWKLLNLDAAQTSFSDEGQFGFSAMVAIPLPTSAALAGVSILGLALRRRR